LTEKGLQFEQNQEKQSWAIF